MLMQCPDRSQQCSLLHLKFAPMPCRASPVCCVVTSATSLPGDKASTVRNMLVTTSPILRRLVVPSIACNFEIAAQAATYQAVKESRHMIPALGNEAHVLFSDLSIRAGSWYAGCLVRCLPSNRQDCP